MAKLGIDVSAIKTPFEPLPEGNYRFKVTGADNTRSKAGNAMVALEYEVIGHEKLSGRKAFNWAVLDQQSGKYLIHQHAVIAGDNAQDPDPETWLNTEFEAEVSIEDGDRGPQNRVVPLIDLKSL